MELCGVDSCIALVLVFAMWPSYATDFVQQDFGV